VAAIDLQRVSEVSVPPGELPATMAAWVIREERFGEPIDAFQVEEIEVPEPGAFEVIVRVMAAGVNYNNVWAALGEPVSVMKYGDHPEFGHHIGGSDASGIVWKVGAGVTRWKPGDEVVLHCNMASYEDPEVHGLDPMAAPSQRIWGYETTWGSFAQFTKVQAQQLLPKPHTLTWEEAASYGLVYFTAYRMLITRCKMQAGAKVLIWGAAGGLGVFATQLCAAAGAHCVGVVSSPEKGELVKRLGAVDFIDRAEFAGMMRKGGESPAEEKARFGVSREFAKRVKQILGDAPDIVFEHVGQATFPTSVFTVKPFGKVVICAGTTGYNLDFDVRYLWMKQKEIIGSHFANAYECMKANELIESGQIKPVLWRTLGFDGVGQAHQWMRENKHLGKISILVGAEREGEGRTAELPGGEQAAIHAEVGN
jgi:crotonyl-CoA carboxylase/reductase